MNSPGLHPSFAWAKGRIWQRQNFTESSNPGRVVASKKEFYIHPFNWSNSYKCWFTHNWWRTIISLPLGLGWCQPTSLPVSSWCVSVNVTLTNHCWRGKLIRVLPWAMDPPLFRGGGQYLVLGRLSFYLQVDGFLVFEGWSYVLFSWTKGKLKLDFYLCWKSRLYHCLGRFCRQIKVVDGEEETSLTINCISVYLIGSF